MAQETWEMQETQFELHPEGVFVGQLVTFTDEGTVDGRYGPYRRGFYEVQTGEVDSNGEVFFPMKTWVSDSSGENSATTRLRQAVAGRKLSAEERKVFNPQNLVGRNVQIQVIHNERDGKKFANIESVMALPKGAGTQQARQPTAQEAHPPADDSDLPF